MGVQVTFNYPNFVALFPELSNVDEPTAQAWFDVAGATVCRNDGIGPVSTAATQTVLMNFATAHLITLFASQVNGVPDTENPSATPPPNLVGRISNATEGSVSVTAEMPQMGPNAAWWSQTRYGLLWWSASAPYRTMRYIPGPQRYFGPFGTSTGLSVWGGNAFVGSSGNILF